MLGDMFCIFAQEFSSKVDMTGVHEDLCSDAYFAFSHKDSAKVAAEVPFKASCAFIGLKKSVIISQGFTLIFEDESCWHEDDLCELHQNLTIS